MKQLLIICVNHNTYTDLDKFLISIDAAAQQVSGALQVCVAVADNSSTSMRRAISTQYASTEVMPFVLDTNDGYLRSADVVLAQLREQSRANADYCIICNVDLELSLDFFEQLLSCDTTNIGWIAPDIYTKVSQKHENPFMKSRPSSRQMSLWRLMYRFPVLFYWQRKLAKLLASKNEKELVASTQIYAGHGSIMVFTRAFMDTYQVGGFPAFMYGEEIYLAELVQRADLYTTYMPQIKVYNIGGVSTSSLGLCRKAEMNYFSLSALQKLYFKKKLVL